MSDHIGDDAALYALGMLDENDAAMVDRHVAQCDACTRLLAQAFDDVGNIAAAQSQHEIPQKRIVRRRTWMPMGAIAAALAIAILPSAFLLERMNAMHEQMVANTLMMDRLMDSTHRSVAFAGANAQVMYSPDGAWYVIVVRNAKQALNVAWMHDGEKTMLGTTEPHGDVALLYLPKSHRMDDLALLQGDQVVGQARLVY